jgi:predicted transport protein
MLLYKNSSKSLYKVKEEKFKLEKEIQSICENNLEKIFGLTFVKSEFSINNFRIDTLAFNEETKSFVIIEYKKVKNYSVIDQGYGYLSTMLNNKADFIIEYNESLDKNLKRNTVDWSQSKVIFVSPSFTNYQKESINFKDLPIELWEVKKFENDFVYFNNIKAKNPTENIATITKQDDENEELKELKVYSEDDHLINKPEYLIELYEKIKEGIFNFSDEIEIYFVKFYVGFKINNKNFLSLQIQNSKIKIWINLKKGNLDDPKNITRDVSEKGHYAVGDYEIHLKDDENLEYVLSLIKQSYLKNKLI